MADPDWFMQSFLWIATKLDGLQRLTYKHDQMRARTISIAQREQGLPVRQFRLKSRQVGMSTLSAGEIFASVYCNPYRRGLIIAHEKDRARELLGMCHLFYEQMLAQLRQRLARSTTERIQFADTHSRLSIMTAANFLGGRGDTLQDVMISEFCLAPQPVQLIANVEQVVPFHPSTSIIIETTAEGAGTPQHDFWLECHEPNHPYVPVFLAWQDDPSNALPPFKTDIERAAFREQMLGDFPDLEDRQEAYGLSLEQIGWWYQNLKRCQGDWNFCVSQYPCDEHEAWIASGSPIIDPRILERYRYSARQQESTMYDPALVVMISGLFKSLTELKPDNHLDRSVETYLEVWKEPIPGRRYFIGADCSAGYETSDFSSAFVMDMFSLEMMAEFHGRVEPYVFARILASLGYCYNRAIIAPEIDGVGLAVLQFLQLIYHWIYQWRMLDTMQASKRLGWLTTHISRPGLIVNLKKVILECARHEGNQKLLIRSQPLVNELMTFSDVDGKPQAVGNAHDDRVMAFAITLMGIMQETYGMRPEDLEHFSFDQLAGQPAIVVKGVEDIVREVMEWGMPATGLSSIWERK